MRTTNTQSASARGAASAEAHLRSQEREKVAKYAGYYRNVVPVVIDLCGAVRQRRFVWRTQGNHEGSSERGGPAAPLGEVRLGGARAAPHRGRNGADHGVAGDANTSARVPVELLRGPGKAERTGSRRA